MLTISTTINGLNNLQKEIDKVQKLMSLQNDSNYKSFLQGKIMQTLNEVMSERLSGTTNSEYIEQYKRRNQFRDIENGFVLYNDFTIPAVLSTKSTKTRNYSKGFSIALAFEYGVGIVGAENPKKGAWDYNINQYEKGWYYKTASGEILWTRGYEGLEIYRYTKDRIEKNMSSWVNEYQKKGV